MDQRDVGPRAGGKADQVDAHVWRERLAHQRHPLGLGILQRFVKGQLGGQNGTGLPPRQCGCGQHLARAVAEHDLLGGDAVTGGDQRGQLWCYIVDVIAALRRSLRHGANSAGCRTIRIFVVNQMRFAGWWSELDWQRWPRCQRARSAWAGQRGPGGYANQTAP